MNYPRSQFSKHFNSSGQVMGIVKFVPLVPLMAQVAETHFDTCNFCKLAHNATFLYQY